MSAACERRAGERARVRSETHGDAERLGGLVEVAAAVDARASSDGAQLVVEVAHGRDPRVVDVRVDDGGDEGWRDGDGRQERVERALDGLPRGEGSEVSARERGREGRGAPFVP